MRQSELQPDPAPPTDPASPAVRGDVWLASLLMAAAGVILVIVTLRKTKQRAMQRAAEPEYTPQERLAAIRERADSESGIEGRAARAADQIRELTAVLDTRIETLDVLIGQADDRLARLERSMRSQSPSDTGAHAGPRLQTAAASEHGESTIGSAKREIYALADQGLSPSEIAQRLNQHTGKVELILALRRA
ncbi:MAG: hypothetical protein AAGB48_11195 [Planctomycetota bacterium]